MFYDILIKADEFMVFTSKIITSNEMLKMFEKEMWIMESDEFMRAAQWDVKDLFAESFLSELNEKWLMGEENCLNFSRESQQVLFSLCKFFGKICE